MSFKTSFQWFADFNTSTTGMQVVQFSAGGEIVRERLAPMFAHYRKYKLGAIHVKFVPAATLPVDPTGLSYEEGEQTVDPRDMFNPGLVRTTNGEDVYIPDENVLNSEFAEQLYYSTMLDKRWKKFRLQKGITLRAFPKFWGVANIRQNMYPGYFQNVPTVSSASSDTILGGSTDNIRSLVTLANSSGQSAAVIHEWNVGSSPMGLFQTGQKIPMGWMPTGASLKDEFGLLNGLSGTIAVDQKWAVLKDGVVYAYLPSQEIAQMYADNMNVEAPSSEWTVGLEDITASRADVDAGATFAPVPEIPGLLTLVLPKAYKTQFFYRVYVKEDVYFADPVTSINAIETSSDCFLAPMDVFVRDRVTPASPADPRNWSILDGQTTPLNDVGDGKI